MAGTCNVVKSRVILVQVKSSQVTSHKSQKLVTGVRLKSTINAVIEGIHVHRSVKLFLVLLRGLRGAPQSLSTARTPHARPSLCPRKIPAGTREVPYPPRSLLAGPRSVLAGVWNHLWPVLWMRNNNHIDKYTLAYLDPSSQTCHVPTMYFLPKIHKTPPTGTPFVGRPIISGCSSPTAKIPEQSALQHQIHHGNRRPRITPDAYMYRQIPSLQIIPPPISSTISLQHTHQTGTRPQRQATP